MALNQDKAFISVDLQDALENALALAEAAYLEGDRAASGHGIFAGLELPVFLDQIPHNENAIFFRARGDLVAGGGEEAGTVPFQVEPA